MRRAGDALEKTTSLRDEHKRVARRLFIEAARRVFSERGYGATTVDDIVKAAGASRATFYLHFNSKAEVVAAIADSFMPATAEYWRNLDRSLGSRESLRVWMEHAIEWWAERRDILPALHEAIAGDQNLAARNSAGLRRLTNELTGYFASVRGPKKQAEARLRIELLVSQLDEFCMRWVVQKTVEADRMMVLDVLTEIWGDTLGVPRSPRKK
jgi:AcrR family transcriptional regulator